MTDTRRLDWVLATRAVVLSDEDGLTLSFAVDGVIRTMPDARRDPRALVDRAMRAYPVLGVA